MSKNRAEETAIRVAEAQEHLRSLKEILEVTTYRLENVSPDTASSAELVLRDAQNNVAEAEAVVQLLQEEAAQANAAYVDSLREAGAESGNEVANMQHDIVPVTAEQAEMHRIESELKIAEEKLNNARVIQERTDAVLAEDPENEMYQKQATEAAQRLLTAQETYDEYSNLLEVAQMVAAETASNHALVADICCKLLQASGDGTAGGNHCITLIGEDDGAGAGADED